MLKPIFCSLGLIIWMIQDGWSACESMAFKWRTEYDVVVCDRSEQLANFSGTATVVSTYQDQYCGDQLIASYFAGGAITFLNLRLVTQDSVAAFSGASFRMGPNSLVNDAQQDWITSYLNVPVFELSTGHNSLDQLSIMTSKFAAERPISVMRLKSGDELTGYCR